MDQQIIDQHGLSSGEYSKIIQTLKREPTLVELGMYSVLWSEHCSYKSSKIYLKNLFTKNERILQGPGENAGIIDIGDGFALVMKIESHNHPSAVEPFQGAATGVGGIVRDIFTMGARPIALLNSLRFGPLDQPHNRFLFDGVVSGISSYGNCLGLPTVAGEVYFDESYTGNCLVNAMCVGLVRTKPSKEMSEIPDIIVKARAEGTGNPVLYVGSSTGRDGIHGATFASVELDEKSQDRRPNVQVGDPFTEKLLIEACLELLKTGNVVGMQDMGAAGLTSSLSEMASRGDCGIEIDIDKIPKREENITPYEIMLSESQERMAVVMTKGTEESAFKIFKKWGLNAAVIGSVTDDRLFKVLAKGEVVAQIPVDSLTNDAPVYERPTAEISDKVQSTKCKVQKMNKNYNKTLLDYLSDPNIAKKEWVYQQYDHMVQTNTVVAPGRGDAAVLRIKGSKNKIALTTDCNGDYCAADPYAGGKICVAEAARNLVCVGARPIAVTDCLNFGNPEKTEIMFQFKECVRGMDEVCRALNTPIISGNVSFYNENNGIPIYPTPVIGMMGLIEGDRTHCTMDFKDTGDIVVLLGVNKEEHSDCPEFDLELEKSVQKTCLEAINLGIIKSAHDTSEGGLACAVSECAILSGYGAQINVDEKIDNWHFLFAPTQSRIIVTINPEQIFALKDIAMINNSPISIIGKVGGKKVSINKNGNPLINISLKKINDSYNNSVSSHMRS